MADFCYATVAGFYAAVATLSASAGKAFRSVVPSAIASVCFMGRCPLSLGISEVAQHWTPV